VRLLSGGNQQKVVLGKWLAGAGRDLHLRRADARRRRRRKVEIYNLMNRLTARGAGIIMISSELPELLGMSDRDLVMHRGRIQAELAREDATEERVLSARWARTAATTSWTGVGRAAIRHADRSRAVERGVVDSDAALPPVSNLVNVVEQTSINAIVAVGMTFVILSGGIDLSVGSIVALAGVVLGSSLQAGHPIVLAVTLALARVGLRLGQWRAHQLGRPSAVHRDAGDDEHRARGRAVCSPKGGRSRASLLVSHAGHRARRLRPGAGDRHGGVYAAAHSC
jgi:energy-coupling factor transporter ATP-binding protein EcfA2